jgi:hypothetical protein
MGALVAMVALGSLAAASASASLPEFTGPFPIRHEASYGEVKFETTTGSRLECSNAPGHGGTGTGEITAAKTITLKLTLKGCKYASLYACKTEGASEGEIRTGSIKGTLVYLAKATKEVGIAFNPYEPKTLEEAKVPPTTLASINCSNAAAITLRRTLLGHVRPVNTATTGFEQWFAQNNGQQTPSKYENEGAEWSGVAEVAVNAGSFKEAGFQTNRPESKLFTEKVTEVKA